MLNVLVVGCGMYVCGRGTDNYGTVLPAILEWKKKNQLGRIYLVGSSAQGIQQAREKINQLQQEMGVQVAISYQQAMPKILQPACAIVAVPDYLHGKVAAETMEGRLHTLVVKPLAPTLKEVKRLLSLQDKNGVYAAVEFHKRLDWANLKLKDVISGNSIGEPLSFFVEFSQRKSVPAERFIKWVDSTNVFQYLGVHYVDIIYFVTQATPKRAMAVAQKGYLAAQGINAYDAVQGVIEWQLPSGRQFSSHILTHWVDPEKSSAMSEQRIKVIGTKGNFESDQKRRGITIVTDQRGVEEPNPYFCAPYGSKGAVSYRGYGIESIQQFLNDVAGITQGKVKIADLENKRATFKQAVVSTAVLEAISDSLSHNNRWVEIQCE